MSKTKDQSQPGVVDKMDKTVDKFVDKMDKTVDKFVDKMDKAMDKSSRDAVDKAVDKFTDKLDKLVDKLVHKAGPGMSEDQNSAWYQYGGEAFAVGENTFAQVDSSSKIVDHGSVITAKINIKATAIAQGDSTYASADTYIVSNFDISFLIKLEEERLVFDGVSYDISNAKFIGIDFPDYINYPGELRNMEVVIIRDGDPDWDPKLDSNVAVVSVSAQAVADNTLVTVEVGVLAVEDTLSYSGLEVTSAVA